jgi:hypothetical protein
LIEVFLKIGFFRENLISGNTGFFIKNMKNQGKTAIFTLSGFTEPEKTAKNRGVMSC